MYQTSASARELKKTVKDIEGFDVDLLLRRLDEIEVSRFQTMPQEMTRIQGQWLGSNELSAEIQKCAPGRAVSFAAAEPLNAQDVLNKPRLNEVEMAIVEKGLKGLLLTPPIDRFQEVR